MVITFLVQMDHFKRGDVFSCMSDPVALALKERLELSALKGDLVAVGKDEAFLIRDNRCYIAEYDFDKFYEPQPVKARALTLKFKEV